jgi:hypothetical protein
MQVKVNANHTIQTQESLERWASAEVSDELGHYRNDIHSVEVHLSDENSNKVGPNQRRCMIEARLNQHAPVAVSHQANRLDEAIYGACDKLNRALSHALGRRDEGHGSRDSIRRHLET